MTEDVDHDNLKEKYIKFVGYKHVDAYNEDSDNIDDEKADVD